jgi:hypothetical protein
MEVPPVLVDQVVRVRFAFTRTNFPGSALPLNNMVRLAARPTRLPAVMVLAGAVVVTQGMVVEIDFP